MNWELQKELKQEVSLMDQKKIKFFKLFGVSQPSNCRKEDDRKIQQILVNQIKSPLAFQQRYDNSIQEIDHSFDKNVQRERQPIFKHLECSKLREKKKQSFLISYGNDDQVLASNMNSCIEQWYCEELRKKKQFPNLRKKIRSWAQHYQDVKINQLIHNLEIYVKSLGLLSEKNFAKGEENHQRGKMYIKCSRKMPYHLNKMTKCKFDTDEMQVLSTE